MKHLFVTQDYGPDRGGMARRHVELCRRFADADNTMAVSTVANDASSSFDAGEKYALAREPFPFSRANRFANQIRWAHDLVNMRDDMDVIHCGNIRPVGYAVQWAHRRLGTPYIIYVNGGDLLRERRKAANPLKRMAARQIFSHASGVAATSKWVADLAADVMKELGVPNPPPVGAFGLGTDPLQFSPTHDSGAMRQRWGIGNSPVMITVARLVPHKGQDVGLRVLAALQS